NTQEKAPRRRDVLEKSEGCHPKMTCGMTEPDQRQTGNDPGARQKEGKRPVCRIHIEYAFAVEIQQIEETNWSKERRFKKEAWDWPGARFLAQETVDSK